MGANRWHFAGHPPLHKNRLPAAFRRRSEGINVVRPTATLVHSRTVAHRGASVARAYPFSPPAGRRRGSRLQGKRDRAGSRRLGTRGIPSCAVSAAPRVRDMCVRAGSRQAWCSFRWPFTTQRSPGTQMPRMPDSMESPRPCCGGAIGTVVKRSRIRDGHLPQLCLSAKRRGKQVGSHAVLCLPLSPIERRVL